MNTETYTKEIITLLAEKYGFDAEIAIKDLMGESEVSKEVAVSSKEERRWSKVLPWVGVVIETNCRGLKWCHGLHTQCRNVVSSGELCKTCNKNGCKYGRVEDRLKVGILEYVDPNGKKTEPFINVAERLNLSIDEINREVMEYFGCEIPKEHLVKKKKRRGRPKKSPVVHDSDDDTYTKKKPGRPKKSKKMMKTVGDDIIDDIIAKSETPLALPVEPISLNIILENLSNTMSTIIHDMDTILISDETEVTEFIWEGILYWRDNEDQLYDPDTQEPVGTYDPINDCVTLI